MLLILDIMTGVRRDFIMILVCISVMMSHVEHLPMCLLAICRSSWEECLFCHCPFLKWIIWFLGVDLGVLIQVVILESQDQVPHRAPGAWRLLLPLPVSLPVSLPLSLSLCNYHK